MEIAVIIVICLHFIVSEYRLRKAKAEIKEELKWINEVLKSIGRSQHQNK